MPSDERDGGLLGLLESSMWKFLIKSVQEDEQNRMSHLRDTQSSDLLHEFLVLYW